MAKVYIITHMLNILKMDVEKNNLFLVFVHNFVKPNIFSNE